MQQQMSLITLGVEDIPRAKAFYENGFGWKPVFEMDHISFYQLNGFVFGLWGKTDLEGDMQRPASGTGAFALAHNVSSRAEVDVVIAHLLGQGAKLLRAADDPPHGGYRGYVADPDGNAWEIAWNASWPISPEGYVTFAT